MQEFDKPEFLDINSLSTDTVVDWIESHARPLLGVLNQETWIESGEAQVPLVAIFVPRNDHATREKVHLLNSISLS